MQSCLPHDVVGHARAAEAAGNEQRRVQAIAGDRRTGLDGTEVAAERGEGEALRRQSLAIRLADRIGDQAPVDVADEAVARDEVEQLLCPAPAEEVAVGPRRVPG